MFGATYTLGLDPRGMASGFDAARSMVSGFSSGIGGMLAGVTALTGGVGLAAGAVMGFKKAIREAATMEGMETSFKVLLGGAKAARERMGELAKFATDTPFELPEVVAASRTLETLTKGAMSTGAGLTLVGDVASGTQQPFAELAVTIGRLYDGLQSGRPVGEAMARMSELGVISGETRDRLEKLQQSGAKGDAVWQVAAGALGRFSGMMKEQSGTWDGMMSNLGDSWNALFREFGRPVMMSLKPMLADSVDLLGQMTETAQRWGQAVGTTVSTMRGMFQSGTLGEAAGLSLKVGFISAVEYLDGAMTEVFSGFNVEAKGMFSGMDVIFAGIGQKLGGAMNEAMANIGSSISIMGKRVVSAEDEKSLREQAAMQSKVGGAAIQAALKSMMSGGGATGQMAGFMQGLSQDKATAAETLAGLIEANRPREMAGPGREEFEAQQRASREAQKAPVGGEAIGGGPMGRMEAAGDRLAKIGLFIGGGGGPKGQKAAEETARATGRMVPLLAALHEQFETMNRNFRPAGVF